MTPSTPRAASESDPPADGSGPVRPSLGDFGWAETLRRRRAERGGPSIVAIIHTRNEERNLPDALRSVAWVDRVVVVDMESEDRTVEIAREQGAEILTFPNV